MKISTSKVGFTYQDIPGPTRGTPEAMSMYEVDPHIPGPRVEELDTPTARGPLVGFCQTSSSYVLHALSRALRMQGIGGLTEMRGLRKDFQGQHVAWEPRAGLASAMFLWSHLEPVRNFGVAWPQQEWSIPLTCTPGSGSYGFEWWSGVHSGLPSPIRDSRKLTSLNWIIHLEWIRVGQMGVPFNSVFTRLMKLVQPAEGPNVSQTCMLPFTYSRRKQASPAHPRVTNTLAIVCSDISPHSA